MSDFSELCPLFNTGVFNEVTFPRIDISMTALSATAVAYNLLTGSLSAAHSGLPTAFTFGRTVVVTDAYLRRGGTVGVEHLLWLEHRTSKGAAPTVFGTYTLTTTICYETAGAWRQFATVTAKTFTSSEVLGLGIGTFTVDATLLGTLGGFDLIVRYKEK